jgi:uncharacterized protein YukE
LLVGICDILVFPDFILDSKTRMRWCKHSIFSLWLRSALTTMIKSVDDLKKEILSVSGRVRELENLSTDLTVKVTEWESSCQGVSNIFDNAYKRIKTNTRNIILRMIVSQV